MNSETVFGNLGKWVNEPLEKLPSDLHDIVAAYVPKWQTLTPTERTARAIEVDRQRGIKSKLRYDRAVRKQKEAPQDPVENQYWFDLFALIDDKKQEIAKWEALPAQTPSEALIKEKNLAAMRAELASLENQSNAPYPAPLTETVTKVNKPAKKLRRVA